MGKSFSVVGRSAPKVDALNKALGKAVYSEDLFFPGMLFGRVLRAGIPHAHLKKIDASKARKKDGVVCI